MKSMSALVVAVALGAFAPSASIAAPVNGSADKAQSVAMSDQSIWQGSQWLLGLDVAGVRIGMSPQEAEAAVRRAGFTIQRGSGSVITAPVFSWRDTVEIAVARRKGRQYRPAFVHPHFFATGPRKQEITVTFSPTPSGFGVSYVNYEIAGDQLTAKDFENSVLDKYKRKPTKGLGNWCYTDGQFCDTPGMRLTIESDLYGKRLLTLEEGSIAKQRREALINAAVDQRAPLDAKPNF